MLQALCNLTGSDRGIELVLVTSVVPTLVEFLRAAADRDGSPSAAAAAAFSLLVLTILRNLGSSLAGKEIAIQSQAVDAMVPLIRLDHVEVRRTAAAALMALAIDERGKAAILRCAIPPLALCLLDDDPDVVVNASTAILVTSELPAAKLAFVRSLLPHLTQLSRIFGRGAAGPLVALLADDNRTVRARACAALFHITSGVNSGASAVDAAGGVEALSQCVYAVERLAACVVDSAASLETVSHAAETLVLLASLNESNRIRLRACATPALLHAAPPALRALLSSSS